MKTKRRLFFYALVAAFAVLSPFVLAYSFGYKFNLANTAFEPTGGIFVKSSIPRLSIFMNGNFMKETSFISGGALLTEIRPGVHILRLEKEGYMPWLKAVEIEPTLVVELRNIILAPIAASATTTEAELLLITERTATTTPSTARLALDRQGNLIENIDGKPVVRATAVHSFKLVGNNIYYISNNGFLLRLALGSETPESLGRPGFTLGQATASILESSGDDLAIIDSAGELFIYSEGTITQLAEGVKKAHFDRHGEKIIAVKEKEIELIWVRRNSIQPFQPKWHKEKIIATNSPIIETAWFYRHNAHILFLVKEGLYLTEIDGRGGRNTFELVSGKVDGIFTAPDTASSVFYKKGGTWFKIEM